MKINLVQIVKQEAETEVEVKIRRDTMKKIRKNLRLSAKEIANFLGMNTRGGYYIIYRRGSASFKTIITLYHLKHLAGVTDPLVEIKGTGKDFFENYDYNQER